MSYFYATMIIITALLGLGFILYYLWYLTWPVVTARVVRTYIHDMPSVVVSRRRFLINEYQFQVHGRDHGSNRQGLILRYGFAPRVDVGDVVPFSISPLSSTLSCPRRPFIELLLLVGWLVLLAIMAYIFYLDL